MNRKLIAAAVTIAVVLVATASLRASRRSPAHEGPSVVPPSWTVEVAEAERAIEAADTPAAVRATDLAWGAALQSRRWEALLAAGDLRVRLGHLTHDPDVARVAARTAYLAALDRARARGSVEGVLRVAEAFALLGDREVVHGILHVARNLAAARHPEVGRKVDLESERIVALLPPPSPGDAYPWARTSYDTGRTVR